MPFKCFAMIKASADRDGEAQKEGCSHRSLLRRGPITGNLFPVPGTDAGGKRGSGSGGQQSCSAPLQQTPLCQLKGGLCVE